MCTMIAERAKINASGKKNNLQVLSDIYIGHTKSKQKKQTKKT